jgi:hypothetical protein
MSDVSSQIIETASAGNFRLRGRRRRCCDQLSQLTNRSWRKAVPAILAAPSWVAGHAAWAARAVSPAAVELQPQQGAAAPVSRLRLELAAARISRRPL